MDPPIGRKFRVKGGSHDSALPYQHRGAIPLGQNLDRAPGLDKSRSANEDHLQRTTGKAGFSREDCRIDLPAVSVALDDGIQEPE